MPTTGQGGVRRWLYCLLVATLLTSCARPQVPPPAPVPPLPDSHVEYGIATWYGRERQGRRTANGEIFDSDKLTAAHRTAPLGVYARVTNLANGQMVWVRINDRGPAIKTRILDLSYAAARQLGMVHDGATRVRIEFLAPGRLPPSL
jgi:rare lipoprotein A